MSTIVVHDAVLVQHHQQRSLIVGFSAIAGRVDGNYALGLGLTFAFILGLIFMLDLSLGEINLAEEFFIDDLQARVLRAVAASS